MENNIKPIIGNFSSHFQDIVMSFERIRQQKSGNIFFLFLVVTPILISVAIEPQVSVLDGFFLSLTFIAFAAIIATVANAEFGDLEQFNIWHDLIIIIFAGSVLVLSFLLNIAPSVRQFVFATLVYAVIMFVWLLSKEDHAFTYEEDKEEETVE